MIEVYKLSKYYQKFPALKELSFKIPQGEVVGLLGPNGAGKTTCLRILSGYLMPSSGECRISGLNVFTESLDLKAKIGYLPENPPLYYELLVKDYLHFIARLRALPENQFPQELDRVLALTQLEKYKNSFIHELSFGYRKRLGIAQALIASPEVLILDEPVSGLDPRQIVEMRKMLRNLSNDYTILLSSHILAEVTRICDRVLVINEGSLVGDLSGSKLKKNLEKEFLRMTA